ncbi:MAG: hypothetical protein EA369_03960 [Bradymonadales bacterium]|nr:MAG: hypothetical protein EA369_03960 [Bradymonadales bacterium]
MSSLPSESWSVFSDFDGTISQQDSLKLLFQEALGSSWLSLEGQIESSEISEREAVKEAVKRMYWTWPETQSWLLENISIDPGFASFYETLTSEGVSFVILSGGFQNFIEALFEREGLKIPSIRANRLEWQGRKWKLLEVQGPRLCDRFSHCKCVSLMQLKSGRSLYIGDGYTDFCPVEKMDFVLAKSKLKSYCEDQKIPYFGFSDFYDVEAVWDSLRTDTELPAQGSQVG